MPAVVNNVDKNSIAEDLGIKPRDEIITINNIKPQDLIDYKYLISAEEITLHIRHYDNEEEIFDIEKDIDDDLGINFESAVFDRIIPCNNKCIFCFVDQQPDILRESLYIKDDDYRLSYLQGTYVTLTNLRSQDRARIEALRPGPLYISVHTTNPDLRAFMLNNPKAKDIITELKWLNNLDIPVHVQIVLCPEINDEKELDRTLDDLSKLQNILSIAVVPVGTTKYRKDNKLTSVTADKARAIISQIYNFNKKMGYNLAFPADELYILAENNFPQAKFYGGFGQLDDGIGTGRLLIDDYEKNKLYLPAKLSTPKTLTIATGEIASRILRPIVNELNNIENLDIDLIAIKSNFWGNKVSVAGLITGQDLIDNLSSSKSKINNLILPSVMLRKYTDQFLDSITLENIQNCLDTNIQIINNYYSTDELIKIIKS